MSATAGFVIAAAVLAVLLMAVLAQAWSNSRGARHSRLEAERARYERAQEIVTRVFGGHDLSSQALRDELTQEIAKL